MGNSVRRMLRFTPLVAMLVLAPVASLRIAPKTLNPVLSTPRQTAPVMMSDAKGRKEWKFVKGINDYGKEQTYIYLGEKEGQRFAWDPFGCAEDETLALLWEKAYIVALVSPLILASIAALAGVA